MNEQVVGLPMPPKRASEVNCANPGEVMNELSRAITATEELIDLGAADAGVKLNRVLLNQNLIAAALLSLIGGVSGAFRPTIQTANVVPLIGRH